MLLFPLSLFFEFHLLFLQLLLSLLRPLIELLLELSVVLLELLSFLFLASFLAFFLFDFFLQCLVLGFELLLAIGEQLLLHSVSSSLFAHLGLSPFHLTLVLLRVEDRSFNHLVSLPSADSHRPFSRTPNVVLIARYVLKLFLGGDECHVHEFLLKALFLVVPVPLPFFM